MTDERLDLPSASGLERLVLCPGSWQLEKGLPSPDSEDSARGTRIHAALAVGRDSEAWKALDHDEAATAERCLRLASQAIEAWATPAPHVIDYSPPRYYLRRGIKPIFSGQPDLTAIEGNVPCKYPLASRRALILDYKTSWGEHTESAGNLQLMAYAVLLHMDYGPFASITVGIVQPLAGGPVQLTTYHLNTLQLAYNQIILAMNDAAKPDAPRRPGPKQCNFCRAKAICPEFGKQMEVTGNTQLAPTDSTLGQQILPEDLAAFYDKCSWVIRAAEKGKAWCQALVKDNPEKYATHFAIEESTGRESIGDLETVHARMLSAGCSSADVLACMTARKADGKGGPGLKGVLARASGLKGKALSDALDGILAGCTKPGMTTTKAVRIGALEDGE